jgi:hypothetical protein
VPRSATTSPPFQSTRITRQLVFEREVEALLLGHALGPEPLVGLRHRAREAVLGLEAHVLAQPVDAEHDAAIPAVDVRRDALHQHREQEAIALDLVGTLRAADVHLGLHLHGAGGDAPVEQVVH